MPRVSVIIPTYNYGRFLPESIGSAQRQTVSDLEIIVVDDGSTDETPQILAGISEPRLTAVRTPNGGISAARNRGLDMATGDYIAFLDADDRWAPDKLERQLAMFESEPGLGLVFTNFSRFNERGTLPKTQFDFIPELGTIPTRPSRAGGGFIIEADPFESLVALGQFASWPSTVMVRRDLVVDLRFPARSVPSEDQHYMYHVYARVRAGFITDPVVELRRHGRNSYAGAADKLEPEVRTLIQLLSEDFTAAQRLVLRRRLGRAWWAYGHYYFRHRAPLRAARGLAWAAALPGHRAKALAYLLALPLVPFLKPPAPAPRAVNDPGTN